MTSDKIQFLSQHIESLSYDLEEAESSGKLTDHQLSIIHHVGLFNMFVPERMGGLGLDLPDAVRIEEKLAYLDGSLGWTVTLCSGAAWFVGFLEKEAIQEVGFGTDDHICFGGSGAVGGIATVVEDGFLINGKWAYATGTAHNTIFTANCVIHKNGIPVIDQFGNPLVKSFYFKRNEVHLLEDWNTMGLKATSSHSFQVNNLGVTNYRAFDISPVSTVLPDLIYKFPFVQFAEFTLAVNYLGMFRKFYDLCNHDVSSSKAELEFLSQQFYDQLDNSWNQFIEDGVLTEKWLSDISSVCRKLVHNGLAGVCGEFPKTGIKGADLGSAINRVWRDIFTGTQHQMFRI